jgi:hypothetical protein
MRRLCISSVLVVAALAASSSTLSADVRSDQKIKFQLGGMLGKMINMFSKGAREGVTTTVAVKGNRKATMNGDTTGQIIDLSEEKIYDLDLKKKTYKVTTFADLRRQMEEAKRKADEAAQEERASGEPSKPADKDPSQKEYEVDFDIKNTNESRTINGFDTKKTVMTITVREKGKTLNDAGGLLMTTDAWLTESAPSTKDLIEFDRKYAEKIYGPSVAGASTQDMAMALAMYPQLKPAMEKAAAEGNKVSGTAILTDMKVEAIPPGTANQTAEALPAPEEPKKKGFGGMLGGLKKMAEQAQQQDKNSGNQKPQRSIIMTTSVEMLKLTTDVDAASVAVPAGFKEAK